MSTLAKTESKELFKFDRVETEILAYLVGLFPIAAAFNYFGTFWVAILVIIPLFWILNVVEMIDKASFKNISPAGYVAALPWAGMMMPYSKILKPGAYDELSANDGSTIEVFLVNNEETLESWDELFYDEMGDTPVNVLMPIFSEKVDFIPLVGEGFHAWYVGELENNICVDLSEDNSGYKLDRMMYKAKIARAKKKGEYIPVHWEKVVKNEGMHELVGYKGY